MRKFETAISFIQRSQIALNRDSFISDIDPRALLISIFLFFICLLSLPLDYPDRLIWFAVFPILLCSLSDISYSKIFVRSLYVLPFIFLIGIFNPFLDHRVAFKAGEFDVTYGWLSFISIMVRGLLCMQALLILIEICGFIQICNALRKLGLPKILTTQLLLLYRYIGVLLQEASDMHRAAISRGYGKKSFPLKLWATFTGSLLIRSYERSKRLHYAMISRGFDGTIPIGKSFGWNFKDSLFIGIWGFVFIFLTFYNLTSFLMGLTR